MKQIIRLLLGSMTLLLLFNLTTFAQQTRLYVKKGSAGDGSAWSNAIGELHEALTLANQSNSIQEIWVSEGTYYPAINTTIGPKYSTFNISKASLKLVGGFAGTESSLEERTIAAHATILSGNISPDQSYSTNQLIQISATGIELEGFTVTGNNTYNEPKSYYPAITITRSYTTLKNLRVEYNSSDYYGGGIYISNALEVQIENSLIQNNTARHGGGIYCADSQVSLSNVEVANNTANTSGNGGGGIFATDTRLSLSQTQITQNTSLVPSSPVSSAGGGGIAYRSSSNFANIGYSDALIMHDVIIEDNSSSSSGGGLHLYGLRSNSASAFTNVTIRNNAAVHNGGGVFSWTDNGSVLSNFLIEENTATQGAGVYVAIGTYFQLTNSIVRHNVASDKGGGFYGDLTNFSSGNTQFYANIVGCILSQNSATTVGAEVVYDRQYSTSTNYNMVIANTIISNSSNATNHLYIDPLVGNNLRFISSILVGAKVNTVSKITLIHSLTDFPDSGGGYGNIAPDFLEPTLLFKSTNPADNTYFQPKVGSVLHDKGVNLNYYYQLPSTDLAGNPRIFGNAVDVGPFEIQQADPYQTPLRLHVKKGANGTGLSWDDALGEVSEALQIAYQKRFLWTAENPLKILVAKGTYRPAYRAAENLPSQYNTFRLLANVQLYGGFDPEQGITSLTDARQPADYDATILSGDINGDDTRSGRNSTLTLNNYNDNAKHVVTIIGEIGTAQLQGFKIVGGNATNTYPYDRTIWGETINDYDGAAIWLSASTTPFELNDIYFEHNTYQNGAIYHARPLVINNSKFRFNKSFVNTVLQTAQPITLRNTLIEGNYTIGKKDFYLTGSTANAPAVFENTTQVDNHYQGDAVEFNFIEASHYAQIAIKNSVFYPLPASSGRTFTFLKVYGAYATSSMSHSIVQKLNRTDNGNINGNLYQPQTIFRNPAQYDYRPSATSPLINAGANSLYTGSETSRDLANNRRIENTIEIGAYEWSAASQIAQLAQDEATFQAGGSEVLIDVNQDASVSDSDSPHFEAGSLNVIITNGTLVDHQLNITTSEHLTISSDSIFYQNVAFAKVKGINTQSLTFSFNSFANASTLNTLLHNITYRNRNEELADSRFTVQTTLKDGAGGESTITSYINTVRTAISIAFSIPEVPYFVNQNFVKVIDPQVTLSIPQGGNIQTIRVAVATDFESQDILAFEAMNGFTSQYDSNTGILTIEGSGSLADWQNALRTVTYSNPAIVSIPSQLKQLQITLITAANGTKASSLLPISFQHNPAVGPDRQQILYVNKNGAGSLQTGRSWEQTIRELGDALQWAYTNKSQFSAEKPLKIYVAKGIYHPLDKEVFDYQTMGMILTRSANDRENAFLVSDHVEIYGGFDPSNGIVSLTDERILMDETNGTILSGDYSKNDVITGAGSNLTITNNTENSKNVVRVTGTKARLDGLVIRGAYNKDYDIGSALSMTGSTIALEHLLLTGNRVLSGSVISSTSPSTIAHQVTIHKNVVHNRFSLVNLANYGSSIFTNVWNNVRITDNRIGITDNSSNGYSDSGILQARNHRLQLVNAQISSNYLNTNGTDYTDRGIFVLENAELSLANSLVYRNEGPNLIHSTNSSTTLLNSSLLYNNMTHLTNAGSGNSISVYNSIVLRYTGAISTPVLSTTIAKNSLIQGVVSSESNGMVDGTQQLDLSVVFTDAANNDFTLRNDAATSGRTLATNPLINTGDATLYDHTLLGKYDLAGNDRIRDGQIDLGPYELQRGDNPLPVRLIIFRATIEAQQALLTWQTTDEESFSHFEIDRSKDGKSFTYLTQITGGRSHYYITDVLESNTNYYRLKMVDLDGSYSYSHLVSISPTVGSTNSFSVYPNPVVTNSVLTIRSTNTQPLHLIDLQGRVLRTYPIESGTTTLSLPTLPAGMYLLQNQVGEVKRLLVE